MGSIIKSVSLTFEEDSFIKDYGLSPTQLLKEKVWEMKGMITKTVKDKIEKQGNMIVFLNEELTKVKERNEFLENQGENPIEVR